MTTDEGSRELRALVNELVEELAALQGNLHHVETTHMQHIGHAERANQFATHLQGAVRLADEGLFAAAFAIVRTAMERWAIDSIILLGDRYVQLYREVSTEQFADARAKWIAGELPSIAAEPTLSSRGTMRIVRRGLTSESDPSFVLHPLYFEIDRFDPFFGQPDEQDLLVGGTPHADSRRDAEEYRQRYNASMRWSAVSDSLALNDLVSEQHSIHMKVHYRFLSAYVHGHHAALAELARPSPRRRVTPEHVALELLLLYAAQFGARYLQAFLRMVDRPPTVEVADRTRLDLLATGLLERSQHLWFLNDEPTLFDRGRELLDRAWVSQDWTSRTDPMTLDPGEVRYYRSPLERLRRMHESGTELTTGFTYVSPW